MSKARKPFARLLRVSTTRIDGGSLFGSTTKARWERFVSTDRQNRVAVGNYSVLVDQPTGWILVNAGPGDKAPLSLDIAPMRSRSSLLRELRELGLMPKDISVVIYTHLHDEHVGGGTHMTSSGRTLPTFPQARYIVQRAALDEASRPNERSARRYRVDDFEPLVDSGQLEAIEGSMEVVEGVFVEPAPGPTSGHQIVIAQDHGNTYAFLGMLHPTSMHLCASVVSAADWNPEATARTKAEVRRQAIGEGWQVAPVGSDEWVPASELPVLEAFSLGATEPPAKKQLARQPAAAPEAAAVEVPAVAAVA